MEVSGQLHVHLLYLQGKSHWCHLDRMLGGFQSWSGCSSEMKNALPLLIIAP